MVLITGAGGQLGSEVQRAFAQKNLPFKAFGHSELDITVRKHVSCVIRSLRPEAVVNCAAYTDVDGAESDQDTAYRVNAEGAGYLAAACEKYGAELVHISTDYVFGGLPPLERSHARPYVEGDECTPETAYGKTKLEGERLVREKCARHYILRTSWLYGEGDNFVTSMLSLAHHSPVRVVCDQYGTPTSARELTEAIISVMNSGFYGLYHASCEGFCSRFDFAKMIFEFAGTGTQAVPALSSQFPRPAKRPVWSVLENANLKKAGLNTFGPWEDALARYFEEGGAHGKV